VIERPSGYRACRLRVPAELEDLLVAEACALGALGAWVVESEPAQSLVEVYFPARSTGSDEGLAGFLQRLELLGGALVEEDGGLRTVEDRDWLEPYRRSAQPLRLGPLVLDPREPEDALEPAGGEAEGEILLRLPARRAVGPGSHATTRLVLEELLELREAVRGAAVLDVGCGTGVLSLAALRLGASRAVALDCDVAAIGQAAANRRLNQLDPGLLAGSPEALGGSERFHLALVNVIPEQLGGQESRIRDLLHPGGLAVASGILTEHADASAERWRRAGLRELRRRRLDEWTALRLERPAS
jgi:ribosomal protein L11 methyltransferase